MKIVNGIIIEATEYELIDYWISSGYEDVMSYPDFRARMELLGTAIIEEAKT